MRLALIVVLAAVVAGCVDGTPTRKYNAGDASNQPASESWAFDQEATGSPPAGSTVFSGSWSVTQDASAPSAPNVLCQNAQATYPAISLGSKVYADFTLTAKGKPVSGSEDRAIGIIFRIQDANNYYILRANALEDNLVLFKYAGGARSEIQEGNTHVASGAWHDLRVEANGNQFKGYVDGNLAVTATDGTYSAGQVGLWTKADSVSCFDDVTVTNA